MARSLDDMQKQKKDFIASSEAMRFTDDAQVELNNMGTFEPSGYALDQLADSSGIPRSYFKKLRENMNGGKALLAKNVNYWFHHEPKKRMIRTIGPKLRGYVSDIYRPLDNIDLLSAILPTFQERKLTVQSSQLTETKMYLKATLPSLRTEIKVGDVVEAGIAISNSEVGDGSVKIEPLIMVLRCQNGMILNSAFKKFHVARSNRNEEGGVYEYLTDDTRKLNDTAFWATVRDVVARSFEREVFEVEVNKLREAADKKILGHPEKVVEVTREYFGLSEDVGGQMLRNLIDGGELTAWGLSNAVTAIANTAEDYELATTLERVGGQIVELKQHDWQRLSEVV